MPYASQDLATLAAAMPEAGLMDWLARQDLLALTVPSDLGGRGLSLADGVALTFDLARRSGSVGLIYAMHLGQIHTWAAHIRGSAYLTDQLRDLITSRRLVASVVSEPETGGNIHKATAALGSDALRKDTSNTSYVPDAGAFLVTAMDQSGPRPVQRLVMIRADATQAVEKRRLTMMGMQGIHNAAYAFSFHHPQQAVFAEPFAAIASTTMTPATHLLWAALWSGLAAHALDIAGRFIKTELPPDIAAGALLRLSALRNRHYTLNALIRDNLAPAASPFAAAAAINRLKIEGSELAQQVALGCLALVGLRGYAQGGPYSLAEVVADSLAGPLMVANARLQANTAGIDRYSEDRP
jgi:acyl-CoA dehydrogenase